MLAKVIKHATRFLGREQGYLELPVRDGVQQDGTPCMQTAWEPTPSELTALNNGAVVRVTILGGPEHPPIKVEVE